MGSFFKSFFASMLALISFSLVLLLIAILFVGKFTSKTKPEVKAQSILVLDLGQQYKEQAQENALAILSPDGEKQIPGLYDVVRLLEKAKTDKDISGVYVLANPGPNGFAAGAEIRNALSDFKKSGKFILAHADVLTQKSYAVANIAEKIYVSPQGFVEWFGYSVNLAFLKGTLEKLEIEPQIFYAGKFKSATEPLRMDSMSEENKLQTTVWLNDLYNDLLEKTAETRKIDISTQHQLADEAKIRTAKDALDNKLIDGLKYDDEVKDEIKSRLKIDKYEKINFVTINTYMEAGRVAGTTGEKIALIYAEGDIVDGKGLQGSIGGDDYRNLIRKARLDRTIKAIVLRINSGGGSALASENIWRELSLARKEKPVIVSFGDVAASGGYYIACAADSIFALPTTITGSIGVFGIIPNMEGFFKNKLGVSFDGVKTGPYADAASVTRPMKESEKQIIQAQIDDIYALFKLRVAEGRKKDTAYIESIAQGRVWTGLRALEIGLIDRFGGLEEAVQCAARMAKIKKFQLKEFPEPDNILDRIFGKANPLAFSGKLREEMGEENYKIFLEVKKIRELGNTFQARIPFQFVVK